MKTNTLTALAKLLMLLFVTTIGNSQTTILPLQELTIVPECDTADPNANCTAESFKVLGAFLGLEDGTAITDEYLDANQGLNTGAYLFIEGQRTGNKFDLYLEFTLVKYDINNPLDDPQTTPYQFEALGPTQTAFYRVPVHLENYVQNGEINSLYGVENITVGWDNTDDGKVTCIEGNYSACNGDIPDFIAVGPFSVLPQPGEILCNGDTTTLTLLTSGGTSPYIYELLDNDLNLVEANSTGIFNNIPAGIYNFFAADSDGRRYPDIGLIAFSITEPDAITATAVSRVGVGILKVPSIRSYLYVTTK